MTRTVFDGYCFLMCVDALLMLSFMFVFSNISCKYQNRLQNTYLTFCCRSNSIYWTRHLCSLQWREWWGNPMFKGRWYCWFGHWLQLAPRMDINEWISCSPSLSLSLSLTFCTLSLSLLLSNLCVYKFIGMNGKITWS